jgi:hypothetical protein
MSRKKAIFASAFSVMLVACGGSDDGPTSNEPLATVDQKLGCATLQGLTITGSAIGLPSTGAVVAAADVPDTDIAGQVRNYCGVSGNLSG